MASRNLHLVQYSFGKEYRVNQGRVEARALDCVSELQNPWRQLSPEQLSSHVRRNTAVAAWLEQTLGWRRLLRACVGEEPVNVVGQHDARQYGAQTQTSASR